MQTNPRTFCRTQGSQSPNSRSSSEYLYPQLCCQAVDPSRHFSAVAPLQPIPCHSKSQTHSGSVSHRMASKTSPVATTCMCTTSTRVRIGGEPFGALGRRRAAAPRRVHATGVGPLAPHNGPVDLFIRTSCRTTGTHIAICGTQYLEEFLLYYDNSTSGA